MNKDSINPYSQPKSDVFVLNLDKESADNGILRCGKKQLFIPSSADLPARCIKCNDNASLTLNKMIFYYDPIIVSIMPIVCIVILFVLNRLAFILAVVPITCLLSFVMHEKRIIHVRLCKQHSKKRVQLKTLCILMTLTSITLSTATYKYQQEVIVWICFFLILASLFVSSGIDRLVIRVRINKKGTYLKGFGKEFLQSFKSL